MKSGFTQHTVHVFNLLEAIELKVALCCAILAFDDTQYQILSEGILSENMKWKLWTQEERGERVIWGEVVGCIV